MTTDSPNDLLHIASIRNFVRNRGDFFKSEKLQFTYIYANKQKEFLMTFFDKLLPNEQSSFQVSSC